MRRSLGVRSLASRQIGRAAFTLIEVLLVLAIIGVIAAIAVLGLNLLTGFNGQISLGHGAFFAVGAYVSAILIDQFNWPVYATLPVAAIVCFVVGYLFGAIPFGLILTRFAGLGDEGQGTEAFHGFADRLVLIGGVPAGTGGGAEALFAIEVGHVGFGAVGDAGGVGEEVGDGLTIERRA